jgi:hypothetical protein
MASAATLLRAKRRIDPERLDVLAGRVDVEQVVGGGHHRAQLTGTAQLGAVFGTVQPLRRPDAIQVVHQLAALERLSRIKGFVGRHIGKADGQGADQRAHTGIQQVRGRDHAAELVAVGERVDEHMRPWSARIEAVHVGDAGVALSVR